jgi:hypothetical protein
MITLSYTEPYSIQKWRRADTARAKTSFSGIEFYKGGVQYLGNKGPATLSKISFLHGGLLE